MIRIPHRLLHAMLNPIFSISNRFNWDLEKRMASEFWAQQEDYEQYFTNPTAIERSTWLADNVFKPLSVTSVMEVGCNSGRNLRIIKDRLPGVQCKGIDINQRAISFAKSKSPEIDFVYADANMWNDLPKSVDAILTMSVIDHIPDTAVVLLAKNIVATARKWIVCVEFWDGKEGRRGPYKYSRDLRNLFGPLGVKTVRWEKIDAQYQYDEEESLLYLYVGAVDGTASPKIPKS